MIKLVKLKITIPVGANNLSIIPYLIQLYPPKNIENKNKKNDVIPKKLPIVKLLLKY